MKPILKEKLLHPSRNNSRAKFADISRFDTQQKPTKQITDVLADVSDNDTLKMPFISPNEKAQNASVTSLLQLESHKQKSRHQLAHRRVYLIPAPKESIASIDKEPVVVANHRAIEGQLDMFISGIAEDIASRTTMQLPVIVLPREQQMQTDQHQVIANAAGGAAIAGAGD